MKHIYQKGKVDPCLKPYEDMKMCAQIKAISYRNPDLARTKLLSYMRSREPTVKTPWELRTETPPQFARHHNPDHDTTRKTISGNFSGDKD